MDVKPFCNRLTWFCTLYSDDDDNDDDDGGSGGGGDNEDEATEQIEPRVVECTKERMKLFLSRHTNSNE